MQPLAHRKKKLKCIQKEIQDHFIATCKKGRKRRWTKQQNHQFNTMQKKSIKRVHTHTANQERITSPEVSKSSQSASIGCSKRPIKKVGSLPRQVHYTSYKVKGGRAGRENDRRNVNKDAGGGASPHEKTQRNTHMMWREERWRKWTIHPNVQVLQTSAAHTSKLHLTVCLLWIELDMSNNKEGNEWMKRVRESSKD